MSAPKSIEIQFVTAESAALLDRVDADVFDHAIDAGSLAGFLANPTNLLVVARVDEEVVGMTSAIAYYHPDKPLQLFINEVGVSGRFQRHGIASRLVKAMLERGRELGCTEAWVATEENNAAARALYDSLGGVEDEDRAIVYVYTLGS
ncbi:MAG TPA: GNAT family N-acetyltransferase [Woeseiaceae bacterium]|nr:GNAT family N-acetyltransferase [Woeseiaceae bacterium]